MPGRFFTGGGGGVGGAVLPNIGCLGMCHCSGHGLGPLVRSRVYRVWLGQGIDFANLVGTFCSG